MPRTMTTPWPSPLLRSRAHGHPRFCRRWAPWWPKRHNMHKGHAVQHHGAEPKQRPSLLCLRLVGPSPLLHYLPQAASGISGLPELVVHRRVCAQLHVEPLAVTRCPCVAAVDNVCPERMLAKASVCVGKGCFLCQ